MAEDIDDERRAQKKREALERRKEMERERRKAIRAAYARQREAKKKKVNVMSGVRVVLVACLLASRPSDVHTEYISWTDLLDRQMETPVSSMKVAVHHRSPRLPQSLRATGVWSGQTPFLSSS